MSPLVKAWSYRALMLVGIIVGSVGLSASTFLRAFFAGCFAWWAAGRGNTWDRIDAQRKRLRPPNIDEWDC